MNNNCAKFSIVRRRIALQCKYVYNFPSISISYCLLCEDQSCLLEPEKENFLCLCYKRLGHLLFLNLDHSSEYL